MPQACNDPIGVRYLIAAKPENVRRAGKLLGEGPPIFLGKSGILNGDAADDRDRKALGNRLHSHLRSFFLGISVGPLVPCRAAGFKRNEAKGRIAPHKNVKLGSRLSQWREQTTRPGLVEASFRAR